jgi:hypothetical protein
MKALACDEALLALEKHVSTPALFSHLCRAMRLLEDVEPKDVAAHLKSGHAARKEAFGEDSNVSDMMLCVSMLLRCTLTPGGVLYVAPAGLYAAGHVCRCRPMRRQSAWWPCKHGC